MKSQEKVRAILKPESDRQKELEPQTLGYLNKTELHFAKGRQMDSHTTNLQESSSNRQALVIAIIWKQPGGRSVKLLMAILFYLKD